MKSFLILFSFLLINSLTITANATALKINADCFRGTEQLADGKRNMLAVCLKGDKILLSEEVYGDKTLTIEASEDLRATDGNLTVTLNNGDQFVVTAGYNRTMTVEYLLIRNKKTITLTPSIQVRLEK